jgi:hypothetical protein
MQEWIHVVTATKLPIPRGFPPQVFHQYEDGVDPNVGTPFGPDKETMFLLVSRPEMPVVNEVLLKVVQQATVGADGVSYPGQYTDPTWTVGWDQLPQDLAVSKSLKSSQLYKARDTYVAAGYKVGNGTFIFPLTDSFLSLLHERYSLLTLMVNQLAVPSNSKITFSDLSDKEVSVGVDTLRDHTVNFAKAYLLMNEKVVKARAGIVAATTPAAVAAVTWTF